MPVRTKIEISPALVRRISGLDDLARIFFPNNRNHRRAFVAIWLEIKYAEEQFLPSCQSLSDCYQVSPRTIEVVRARMKKLGLIKRISHFNPTFGQRSGWAFSTRFRTSIASLATWLKSSSLLNDGKVAEQKDRDSLLYV